MQTTVSLGQELVKANAPELATPENSGSARCLFLNSVSSAARSKSFDTLANNFSTFVVPETSSNVKPFSRKNLSRRDSLLIETGKSQAGTKETSNGRQNTVVRNETEKGGAKLLGNATVLLHDTDGSEEIERHER